MDSHGDKTKEAAAPTSKLNGADILFEDRGVPTRKILPEKPATPRQPTIGTARMLDDESIVLNLKARGKAGIEGEGELIYKPRDKNYQTILRHLSGLNRGEIKLVSPFDDPTAKEPKAEQTPQPKDGTKDPQSEKPNLDKPKEPPKVDEQPRGKTDIAPQLPQDKAPDQVPDKGPDKGPENIPEKGPEKIPDIAPDKSLDKAPTLEPGKTPAGDGSKTNTPDTGTGIGNGVGKPGDSTVPTDKTPPVVPEQNLPPSQQFLDTVNNTYNAMSKPVRDIIEKDGAKLVPARRLTDALPELKGEKPRGWPPGSTWDAVDGAFSPGKKLIVVAEDVEQPNGQWQKSNRTADITRHEAGHAADAALNYFSSSPEFGKAYDDDKAKISATDAKTLSYFLQSGKSGPEETFAEGIASSEGGSTSGTTFDRNFAGTIAVIKNRVQAPTPVATP